MNLVGRLKRHALRNFYLYFMAFILVFVSVNFVLIFRFNLLFIAVMFSFFMMFMGQILPLTPYSASYAFYVFSCFSVTSISVLYWIARHAPYSDIYLVAYVGIVAVLVGIPLAIHFLTRKRMGTIPMVPVFSIFFFALLITFGISQPIESGTQDMLFGLTIVLFALVSIFGLNITFRNMVLNRKLGIMDKNRYLRKTKEALLDKYTNADTHADIDLLMYYLSSSFDSFVEGDFERSYMDAYKIVFDLNGKAFKEIYVLPENKERQKHFTDIRHLLSHAHISQKKKEKEKDEKALQKLKELKKGIFKENLDLLKTVKDEFIEMALKAEK
jgi:hypothetical protein